MTNKKSIGLKGWFTNLLNRKMRLMVVSLVLSAYTLVAFHFPFFSYVADNVSNDINGWWIVCSMALLMLALNYLIYYLLLYLGRVVGKSIIAISLVGNAVCLYFVNTYNVLIDRSMMGNVFNTQYSEASSFFSWTIILYALLLGVLPSLWLLRQRVDYGSVWRWLANIAIALVAVGGIVGSNYKNTFWIDRHAPVIGSKLMPWSYIVNSIRYYTHWKRANQQEILLPDVEKMSESRDVCVLIIGESARSENFSLYGYERETNPLMKADGVTAIKAQASHTNTMEAVKAILQHKPSRELYEILPNYLARNGVDVVWRTSNWGTPPIRVEKQFSNKVLAATYPEADSRYDGILFHNLKQEILSSDKDKLLICIHTYTSHGPEYYNNSPEEFKRFLPECRSVEVQSADHAELINAYDNTIVYTDYLVHSVIETLREIPDRRSCVIFISDHGESLGEGGLYMHGIAKGMAPSEQLDIPFIVWASDNANVGVKPLAEAGHYHIYHSVLGFLGIQTPFYDESKDIFECHSL